MTDGCVIATFSKKNELGLLYIIGQVEPKPRSYDDGIRKTKNVQSTGLGCTPMAHDHVKGADIGPTLQVNREFMVAKMRPTNHFASFGHGHCARHCRDAHDQTVLSQRDAEGGAVDFYNTTPSLECIGRGLHHGVMTFNEG